MAAPPMTLKSFDVFRTLAAESNLPLDERTLERVFQKILKTRLKDRVQFSVMKRTVEKLAEYDKDVVRIAVEAYLDRNSGEDERYLLAIARNEAKRQKVGRAVVSKRRDSEGSSRRSSSALPEATRHLTLVVGSLRDLYRERADHAELIKEVGSAVSELQRRAAAGTVSATEVDKVATELEKRLRIAMPGQDMPVFTPYGWDQWPGLQGAGT